jgi:hypothetical protein
VGLVGGVAESGVGAAALIAPEPTGVTKVGGAYLVAHGADTMGTSMAELVSGEHQEKLFHRAIRAGVGTVTENEAVATGAVIASEVGSLGVGIGVARGMAGATQPLRFTQTTASPAFSADGTFAGKTIGSLASELRSGEVVASQVPVSYVVIEGNTLVVNTRSSLALTRAGIPQSEWTWVNSTAREFEAIQERLLRNGLTSEGTPTIRITGMGGSASSLK